MAGLARRLRHWIVALAPLASSVALVMATAMPLYLPHVGSVTPQLGVAAVFYWSIYRPDLMSYGSAFAVGIVADVLSGAPLGITALALVVVRRLVLAQRRFFLGKPFHVLWSGFLIVALAASLVVWIASSLYLFTLLAVVPLTLRTLVTVALFPVVAWLLARCQVLLPMPRGMSAVPRG